MNRLDIEKDGLLFKNLLSGPAPVGRILNYVYLAGTTGLYHKNGYRSLDQKGQVGSAWATEFMIGLGIITLGTEIGDKSQIILTKKGQKLFELINIDDYVPFDESINVDVARGQMKRYSDNLWSLYRDIFVASYPFQILKMFLEENGYVYQDRALFMDDLFEAVKILYDEDPTPYNRDARTTTGFNRVPSLLQLCKLFDMLDDSDGQLNFMKNIIEKVGVQENIEYSEADMQEAIKSFDLIMTDGEKLANKYGIDGNVLVESLVRNSTLQHIFKYNLLVSQNGKCAVCEVKNKELLVGSHIKPASVSNAIEKADYNNGLLLCCNHDKLFDRYLITFNFIDGQIEISKTITDEDAIRLGLDKNFKLAEELLTTERTQYLMEHNIEFRSREENR